MIPRRLSDTRPRNGEQQGERKRSIMGRGLTDKELPIAEAFFVERIRALRTEGYKGCHTRISGINVEFALVFPDVDVIMATQELEAAEKLAIIPVRGGVMLYLRADAPQGYKSPAERDAKKMLHVNAASDFRKRHGLDGAPVMVPAAPKPEAAPTVAPVTVSAAVATNGKDKGSKQVQATA